MTTAYKYKVSVKSGGLISLRAKNLGAGTKAEVIVLVEPADSSTEKTMTCADLLKSGLAGMWAGREDITDSLAFAVEIRSKSENHGQTL